MQTSGQVPQLLFHSKLLTVSSQSSIIRWKGSSTRRFKSHARQ